MKIGDVVRRKDRELFADRHVTAVVDGFPNLADKNVVLLRQGRQEFAFNKQDLEIILLAEEVRIPPLEDEPNILNEPQWAAVDFHVVEEGRGEGEIQEPPRMPGLRAMNRQVQPNPFAGAIEKAREEKNGYEDIEF